MRLLKKAPSVWPPSATFNPNRERNPEEDAGRQLLRDLPLNPDAYFEADNVEDIVRYILSTITQAMKQAA